MDKKINKIKRHLFDFLFTINLYSIIFEFAIKKKEIK